MGAPERSQQLRSDQDLRTVVSNGLGSPVFAHCQYKGQASRCSSIDSLPIWDRYLMRAPPLGDPSPARAE